MNAVKSYIRRIADKYQLIQYYRAFKNIRQQNKLLALFDLDVQAFKESAQACNPRFNLQDMKYWPIMTEKTAHTAFDSHYIYHPAWAARILANIKPKKHIDISSTLYFCAMVSAFIPAEFYDYRPANLKLSNLVSGKGDLLNLPFPDNSVASLSCMHTLEHVGLGRYGDPIDYDGDLKAMKELQRVLATGGDLLVAVPIGKSTILFNENRVYDYDQIISYFSTLKLMEFSLIPDNIQDIGMVTNATKTLSDQQTWGCGCFWFRKV